MRWGTSPGRPLLWLHLSSPAKLRSATVRLKLSCPLSRRVGVILAVCEVGDREAKLFGESNFGFPYPFFLLFRDVTGYFQLK